MVAAPASIAAAVIMVRIALGGRGVRHIAAMSGYLIAAAFITGGAAYSINQYLDGPLALVIIPASLISAIAAKAFARNKRRTALTKGVVSFVYRGRQASLAGVVDSGNLLVDGISGLPVVMIPYERAKSMFPELGEDFLQDGLPGGMRLISLSTAAGRALSPCFTPDIAAWNGETVGFAVAVAKKGTLSAALVPAIIGTDERDDRDKSEFIRRKKA